MDQQIVTIVIALIAVFGTLLGAHLNSRANYKIAKDKLESDEKHNSLKTKLDLKKSLYLEYFGHLSKINTHLISIINEPEKRTQNEVIYDFSSSINKLKLVSDSKIVIKLFDIDKNFIFLHTFIMSRIFHFTDDEILYEEMSKQEEQFQKEFDEFKILMIDTVNKEDSSLSELREKFIQLNENLQQFKNDKIKLFLTICEHRKKIMKGSFEKIDKLDRLNKDLLLLMRIDIGLENDHELQEYLSKFDSDELKSAISDLLDMKIPE